MNDYLFWIRFMYTLTSIVIFQINVFSMDLLSPILLRLPLGHTAIRLIVITLNDGNGQKSEAEGARLHLRKG